MRTRDLHILIGPDGSVWFVHDDTLAGLFAGERMVTRRASHVEPARAYGIDSDGWIADMAPMNGPILTGANYKGFQTRQQALDAEREWIRKETGL